MAHNSPTQDLAHLWREHRQNPTPELRERLILNYAPLVKFVTLRMAHHFPSHIDQADLMSCGFLGLIDAIERFNPDQGVKFEAFATLRIRGAIIDEQRRFDRVPRRVRAAATALEHASARLQQELRRTPDSAEVAAELDISETDVRRIQSEVSRAQLVALDKPVSTSDSDSRLTFAEILGDSRDDPGASDPSQDLRELVGVALSQIDDRDRAVIRMSYFENRTLAAIGVTLGVTESRVSQIRARALRSVRTLVESEMRKAVCDVSASTRTRVAVPA